MEKESNNRLVLRVTPAIFLISLLLLYYNYYCSNFVQFGPVEVGISQTIGTGDEQASRNMSGETKSRIEEHERLISSQETNRAVDDHELKLIIREVEIDKTDDHMLHPESEKVYDASDDTGRRFSRTKRTNETAEVHKTKGNRSSTQSPLSKAPTKEVVHKTRGNHGSTQSPLPKVPTKEVAHKRDNHGSTQSPLSRLVRGEDEKELVATGFACDAGQSFIVCLSDKNVTIDTRAMTMYVPNENKTAQIKKTEVRPYARREDYGLLQSVTPVQIIEGNATPPSCQFTHNEPVVIFSTGGFTGNLFHEFNEVIVPLFITTHHLKSRVRFLIVNYRQSIVDKYAKIISNLSSFKVMNPDVDRRVHCFSGAVAGLKFHDHLTVDSRESPGGYSMPDFRHFLRETYSLKVEKVSEIEKPVLMLISRTTTRRFLNEGEMTSMMKGLGFDVIIVRKPEQMSNLNKFSKVVNKCSVLVGTHGAGLTNQLFLPNGAVTIQVEPLGLEWPSAFYFGNPAPAMGLHYIRYKIKAEESSLLKQYGANHPAIVDPESIFAQGFQVTRTTYVDQQSMIVNVTRFRDTLIEALRLIGHSPPPGNY